MNILFIIKSVEGLVRKNKTQVTETMHQHVKNQAVAVKAMIQEQE